MKCEREYLVSFELGDTGVDGPVWDGNRVLFEEGGQGG